jgi:hypothetical protein
VESVDTTRAPVESPATSWTTALRAEDAGSSRFNDLNIITPGGRGGKLPSPREFHYSNALLLRESMHAKTGIADQGLRAHCPPEPVTAFRDRPVARIS